jgi:hypothetical protein
MRKAPNRSAGATNGERDVSSIDMKIASKPILLLIFKTLEKVPLFPFNPLGNLFAIIAR